MTTSNFKRSLRILNAKQRKSAGWQIVLAFVGMLLETLGVGVVVPTVSLMSQDPSQIKSPYYDMAMRALGNPSRTELVTYMVLAFVAIYFLKLIFLGFLAFSQSRFAFSLQADLSQKLFKNYLNRPYTFHLQHNSAHLINNVQGEVGVFITSVIIPAISLFSEFIVVVGLFLMMVVVEPLGAIVSVIVLGAAAWVFNQVTKNRIKSWSEKRYYHENHRIQHLQQGLGGVKDVKLLGRETEFLNQFRFHNEAVGKIVATRTALAQLPRLWIEFLAVAGIATIIFIMMLKHQNPTEMLPVLALFAAAAFRLMPSVNRILAAVQSIRFGLPAIVLLDRELSEDQDMPVSAASTKPLNKQIQIQNVSFKYATASTQAVQNVSMTFGKGECIGFIGQSGSGKSTLVDVILGLLPPEQGAVLLDGDNIQANLRNWQNQIGYVPQAIYLTDDSLKKNVAFGIAAEDIDESKVKNAIRQAQLEDFVRTQPEGLDTFVGERGVRLSGGQRQRIGIARALYHNPSVLVLDEATSALDNATEQEVMKSVNELRGDKTIIIVAHRLSTVSRCDRIYRMADGKVLGEGTPLEMIPLESGVEVSN